MEDDIQSEKWWQGRKKKYKVREFYNTMCYDAFLIIHMFPPDDSINIISH